MLMETHTVKALHPILGLLLHGANAVTKNSGDTDTTACSYLLGTFPQFPLVGEGTSPLPIPIPILTLAKIKNMVNPAS